MLLQEGDIIRLDAHHVVYADREVSFFNSGKGILHTETPLSIYKDFQGLYLVERTALDGGGFAQARDEYPNGHHVYCISVDEHYVPDGKHKVDFYQSGCFTVMMPDIKPITRLRKVVTWTR